MADSIQALRRLLSAAKREIPTGVRIQLLRLLGASGYDLRRTIFVSGTPRSGTTWLAGLLSTIPRSSILFEPVHPGNVPAAREAGFRWRTFVPPGTEWPEGRAFLERALSGRVLNAWTTREIRNVRPTDTWIVKCVRANRMLAWISEQFPIRPPILLIRHPCAVVASQLRYGWRDLAKPPVEDIVRFVPDVEDFYRRLDKPEEFLAATWALDNLIPLQNPQPHPWQLVCYERLLVDPRGELRMAFDRWSLAIPEALWSRLERPSRTSNPALGTRSREDLVSGWQKKLSSDQVSRILDVVTRFGVDLYGADAIPDEARLTALTSR